MQYFELACIRNRIHSFISISFYMFFLLLTLTVVCADSQSEDAHGCHRKHSGFESVCSDVRCQMPKFLNVHFMVQMVKCCPHMLVWLRKAMQCLMKSYVDFLWLYVAVRPYSCTFLHMHWTQ